MVKSGYSDAVSTYGTFPKFKGLNSGRKHRVVSETGSMLCLSGPAPAGGGARSGLSWEEVRVCRLPAEKTHRVWPPGIFQQGTVRPPKAETLPIRR